MTARRVANRYRLLDRIAIGGMAAVWRARDTRDGALVALKRLHPHLAEDATARERLEREGAAMAAIAHPNVVPVRDVVMDADGPAVVMELVAGRTLAERLVHEGPLEEVPALRLAVEVADGLAAVHQRGLVHRDVKPSNLLLGADGHARLTDFGIAAETDALAAGLTATDGVVGTLRYLAPERLAGAAATPATDVWGVAAVLWEMLTGRPAYPATSVVERAAEGSVLPTRPDGIHDATWAVIVASLAADPSARPPDGAALRGALQEALVAAETGVDPAAATAVIPTPAPAVGPTTRSDRASARGAKPAGPVDRRSLAVALASVGVVAVIGLAALAGPDDGRPDDTDAVIAPVTTSTPTPEPTATPEPADQDGGRNAPDKDKGKDGDKGKGNGNGRGRGD